MCDIYLKFFLQNFTYSKGYIDVVYKSSSQENIPNINFLSNFNELLSKTTSNNSLFTIILDDFNVRSSSWWKKQQKTKQQKVGTHLEALVSSSNFHQPVSEPIYTSTTSFF